jgi:hypothetical protein
LRALVVWCRRALLIAIALLESRRADRFSIRRRDRGTCRSEDVDRRHCAGESNPFTLDLIDARTPITATERGPHGGTSWDTDWPAFGS